VGLSFGSVLILQDIISHHQSSGNAILSCSANEVEVIEVSPFHLSYLGSVLRATALDAIILARTAIFRRPEPFKNEAS
jgi:hypothetical protein